MNKAYVLRTVSVIIVEIMSPDGSRYLATNLRVHGDSELGDLLSEWNAEIVSDRTE